MMFHGNLRNTGLSGCGAPPAGHDARSQSIPEKSAASAESNEISIVEIA